MTPIPIVFIADNNYVQPTGAAINSLIKNKYDTTRYEINIIAAHITADNVERFKQFNSSDVKINIIDFDNSHLKKFNEPGYYVSCAGLLKFEIADLFPEHEKILYLDSDLLILHDLSELYNTDLKDTYVGAVRDISGEIVCRFHQKLNLKKYFNSGVMLLHAKKIRSEKLKELFYTTKTKHPEFRCMDQDVINYIFNENVTWLPFEYNLMMFNILNIDCSLSLINNLYKTHYESFNEMDSSAKIIHLTNIKKPWKYKYTYQANEWAQYYFSSPFKDTPISYVDYYEKSFKILGIPFIQYIVNEKKKCVYFLGIKVFQKNNAIKVMGLKIYERKKSPTKTVVKFFNIPFIRTKTENGYKTKYFLGIRFKRKKINHTNSHERNAIDALDLDSQLKRLESLKLIHKMSNVDLQKEITSID